MSTAVTAVSLPPGPPGPPAPPGLYRLRVEQYERMGEAGILTEDEKVELLSGLLVRKMTKNEPHSAACTETRMAIEKMIPSGWYLRTDAPVRIPNFDEPEPDLAIVRGSSRQYVRLNRPPEPSEVTLVIEVADSRLASDRTEKLRAYAHGGIPTYWIINLVDGRLEVYTQPEGSRYGVCQVLGPGQNVAVLIDGAVVGEIPVADLLP
jgi:Uma2 family endonuclease